MNYQDCYATFSPERLTIGNARIERTFVWQANAFLAETIADKAAGDLWQSPVQLHDPALWDNGRPATATAACAIDDCGGRTAAHLALTVTVAYSDWATVTVYRVFPQLPFVVIERQATGRLGAAPVPAAQADNAPTGIETAPAPAPTGQPLTNGAIDVIPLGRRHLSLTTIKLFDQTDRHDTLAVEDTRQLYQNNTHLGPGNLFLVTHPLTDHALLVVKDAPTHLCQLCALDRSVFVKGNDRLEILADPIPEQQAAAPVHTYGTTVGVGTRETLLRDYKRLYNLQNLGLENNRTFIMSNTWGDRNRDARVSEAFILRELETAHELGIDIVQIDDGWQKGITANSGLAKNGIWSFGYYDHDPNFWQVHPDKFPRGLQPLVDRARELNVQLGLWFSPDSSQDFHNWRRDADTLLNLHRAYGICHFKIDGIVLKTKLGEANLIKLLTAVADDSHNAIHTNLDITAQSRLGYLFQKQFGTIFVENRYTDHRSYFPHNTLKNAWTLAHYFPLRRFQFEFLNNSRNANLYGDDPLAPAAYDIDYTFAAVMLANPLVWMELTGLDVAQKQRLKPLMAICRDLRDDFFAADIHPLGSRPDGCSFTGFQVIGARHSYLLLFREFTPASAATLSLPVPLPQNAAPALLSSNAKSFSLTPLDASTIRLDVSSPRSYALFQY